MVEGYRILQNMERKVDKGMNNEKELIELLLECSSTQQEFFKRLYPNFPKKSRIDNAIMQVKRTIEKNKIDAYNQEKFNKIKNELNTINEQKNKLEITNENLEQELKDIKLELAEYKLTENNNNDAKRLLLLDALEAAGVDNWEWYGEAINIYENNLLSLV